MTCTSGQAAVNQSFHNSFLEFGNLLEKLTELRETFTYVCVLHVIKATPWEQSMDRCRGQVWESKYTELAHRLQVYHSPGQEPGSKSPNPFSQGFMEAS